MATPTSLRPLRIARRAGHPWQRGLALLWMGLPAPALAHNVSEQARQRMLDGSYLDFVWVGAEHMLTGYDHLLFLLGVLFFLRGFGDIVRFVTAFTLGHTLSLIVATRLGISADPYLIDAVIALTVVYKAFENLDGFRRCFGITAPNLLLMVLAFGLIHGFGLSARLQQMTLAKDPQLVEKVLAFNAGVEFGQIAALALMAYVVRSWQQTRIWPAVATGTNVALIGTGALLLAFQLVAYTQQPPAAAAIDPFARTPGVPR